MRWGLQSLDLAADVPGIGLIQQIVDAWMDVTGGAENRFSFVFFVWLPDFVHVQHGEHDPLGVAKRNLAAAGHYGLGERFGYVQGDRHGPDQSVCQLHVVANALVILARHETAQRRKAAADQQFQVAHLARRQVPGGPFARVCFEFSASFRLSN